MASIRVGALTLPPASTKVVVAAAGVDVVAVALPPVGGTPVGMTVVDGTAALLLQEPSEEEELPPALTAVKLAQVMRVLRLLKYELTPFCRDVYGAWSSAPQIERIK